MKKTTFFFSFLVMILFSCKQNQNIVSMEILNDKLHYLQCDTCSEYSFNINYNKLDVLKARNLISYKLNNNTNSKLLFLINPHNFSIIGDYPLSNDFSDISLYYHITDDKNNEVKIITGDFLFKNSDYLEILKKQKEIYENREKLPFKSVFREREIIDNSIILYPNESIVFTQELELPLIKQARVNDNLKFTNVVMTKGVYNFQLFYNYTEEELKNQLTALELVSLQKEGITIFTGHIKSNIVKILPLH